MFISGCAYSKESSLDISKIDKQDIILTLCNQYDYAKTFSGIEELSENSMVVIYGEVIDIQYLVGENGLCRTNMDVKVLQSLKGEYHVGDIIKIVKDQGIVSVNDYIESFVSDEAKELNRRDFEEYSDKQLKELYIQQIAENDIMSEVGQKSVCFLTKSAFYDTEKTFSRLTGAEGEYAEISENQFVQTKVVGSEITQPYRLNKSEVEEKDFYTLEEIISKMKQ